MNFMFTALMNVSRCIFVHIFNMFHLIFSGELDQAIPLFVVEVSLHPGALYARFGELPIKIIDTIVQSIDETSPLRFRVCLFF